MKITQKLLLRQMQGESDRLARQLEAARNKDGFYYPADQYEEDQARLATLSAEVNEYKVLNSATTAELHEKMAELATMQKSLEALKTTCDETKQALEMRTGELRATEEQRDQQTSRADANAHLAEEQKQFGRDVLQRARVQRVEACPRTPNMQSRPHEPRS